uniref:Leucyl aminopeptidase n=1 Tax=Plectus sambesii TaxID=2011161 RepID=A0A914WLW8_9BILA
FIGAHINFTDDVDWLHFDMAAPSEAAERATGYGPALLISLLGKHHTDLPLLNI